MAGRVSRAGKPLLLATLSLVAIVAAAASLYLLLDLDDGTEGQAVTHIALGETEEADSANDGDGTMPETTPSAPETVATAPEDGAETDQPIADGTTGGSDPTPPSEDGASEEPTASGLSAVEEEPEPAWRRFAAAAQTSDSRPRIALVVTGLGLSRSATEAAIRTLPAQVSLSFTPYAKDLESWVTLARSDGHEVLLDLPMEPTTFPNDDPGPRALITSLSTEENLARLDWILGQADAYVGLAGVMGSRFSASEEQLRPVFRVLKERGLLYLDNRPTDGYVAARLARRMGLAHAVNSRLIDDRHASRVTVDARLKQIERVALTERVAVAMARPFPVTLERLEEWLVGLDEQGFQLVPLTAIANRQPAY